MLYLFLLCLNCRQLLCVFSVAELNFGIFAIKQSKIKGLTWEIWLWGIKWQDRHCHIPIDMISKIRVTSPPLSKKETWTFLDIMGFWNTHIPGYSQLVRLLCWVTQNNYSDWGPEHQRAVQQIKQQIVHGVAYQPVQTGPDVRNVLYAVAREHDLNWSLWQKSPVETQGQTLGFWSEVYRAFRTKTWVELVRNAEEWGNLVCTPRRLNLGGQ